MFKIGEFSRLAQISIRMLRYYDEIGLLKPEKTDIYTGYRLYSAAQMETLQKILLLRDMKFSVVKMKEILEHWGEPVIISELECKKEEIKKEVELEQQRMQRITKAILDIKNNNIEMRCNVIFKEIPSYQVLSIREEIPDYFSEGNIWKKVYHFIEAEHLDGCLQTPYNVVVYHDEDYKESDVDIEVCVVVKKSGKDKGEFRYRELEKVETMACTMVYGPFENIGPAYHEFAYWLER